MNQLPVELSLVVLKEAAALLNQPNADHDHEGVDNAHPPLTSRPGHSRGEGQNGRGWACSGRIA
jgi:hypothetical protein